MIGKTSARLFGRWGKPPTDLLFPPRCRLCGSPAVQVQEHLGSCCAPCIREIDKAREASACPTCAASVGLYEVSNSRCSQCRSKPVHVNGTVRLGVYEGLLKSLIRDCKYHGREDLLPLGGAWLADAVARAPWHSRLDAVVSVPTHWTRRLRRPFYAAEALSRVVAKRSALPNLPILRRVRGGPHQIGLSYSARVKNVRGVFALSKGVRLDRPRLLLIDDVKTTGATIEECARVLRKNGAGAVYAAVVVKVPWNPGTHQYLDSI